jgi:hypothetical protein
MTGSGVAQLIIPLAGTLGLIAWLALVFYAGRHPEPLPVPAVRTDRANGMALQRPAPAESQDDLLVASVDTADLRVIVEVS